MAAFDAITEEPPPSRTWEDEDDFLCGISEPVSLSLNSRGQAVSQNGQLNPRLLLVATSRASSALLQHLQCAKAFLGDITLPPYRPADPSLPRVTTRQKYEILELGSSSAVVVVLCPHPVPAERSFEWTKVLFGAVSPERVLVLGAMPAGSFRGRLSPGDAPLFQLRTDAFQANEDGAPELSAIQNLPCGSLVDGLPAAILSHCQLRQRPALLLVAVTQSLSSESDSVPSTATAIWPYLECAAGIIVIDRIASVKAARQRLTREASSDPTLDIYV